MRSTGVSAEDDGAVAIVDTGIREDRETASAGRRETSDAIRQTMTRTRSIITGTSDGIAIGTEATEDASASVALISAMTGARRSATETIVRAIIRRRIASALARGRANEMPLIVRTTEKRRDATNSPSLRNWESS